MGDIKFKKDGGKVPDWQLQGSPIVPVIIIVAIFGAVGLCWGDKSTLSQINYSKGGITCSEGYDTWPARNGVCWEADRPHD